MLVTGATGLLGPYLVAAVEGAVTTTGRRGGDVACDLGDADEAKRLIDRVEPALVLHAAGMTDVNGCEADPENADRVNRRAVANIAGAIPATTGLVYISTDQVYPDTPGPHKEGEEAPINAYGRSKLAGEEAAMSHPDTLVLRTNFFGPSRTPGRQSLSDFVADKLGHGMPVTLFRDSLFSALHMKTASALIVAAAGAGLAGVYNLGSRAGMSKLDFGLEVARRLGLSTENASPGNASAILGRAPRPTDLRMDVTRIEATLGQTMPTLCEEIAKL